MLRRGRGLGKEREGPPPADEDAARAAIGRAFDIGEIDEDNDTVPSVEGSKGLANCRQQATDLAHVRLGGQVPDVSVVFAVDAVRFVNDHEAVV